MSLEEILKDENVDKKFAKSVYNAVVKTMSHFNKKERDDKWCLVLCQALTHFSETELKEEIIP